jgi:hypothetical protein
VGKIVLLEIIGIAAVIGIVILIATLYKMQKREKRGEEEDL